MNSHSFLLVFQEIVGNFKWDNAENREVLLCCVVFVFLIGQSAGTTT